MKSRLRAKVLSFLRLFLVTFVCLVKPAHLVSGLGATSGLNMPRSIILGLLAEPARAVPPPLEVISGVEDAASEAAFPFEEELTKLGLEPWPSRNSMVLKEAHDDGFNLSWWHTVEVKVIDTKYGQGLKVSIFFRDKSDVALSRVSDIAATVIGLQYGFNDTVRTGYQAEILKLIEKPHDSAIYPIVYTKKRNYATAAFLKANVRDSDEKIPVFTIDLLPGNPLSEAPPMPSATLPSSSGEVRQ